MELEHLTLNRVIGLTSLSNASFIASADGNILYAAGCVCVLYNPKTNKQEGFFTVGRAISCMHLSVDGMFLAIGERGHLPCVTVWDVKKQKQIRSYTGHEYGISSVQFSPDGKYLVSIGFKHDKQMMLHEWEIDRLVCVEKMENKVNALSFHASGDFFVTCGDRHLKWWYFVFNDTDNRKSVSGLNGRPASILKAQQDSNFIDVMCCPKDAGGGETSNIYCTTSTGMLCLIHEKRLMDKWVQLDSSASYCLTVTSSFVIVGGPSGDIFVFNPSSLEFITTLPRSAPLPPSVKSSASNDSNLEFAACYGIVSVPTTSCVAAMYADRSIFIWDIADIHSPIKYKSFVFHRACIWDLVFIEKSAKNESVNDIITNEPDSSSSSYSIDDGQHSLPSGTFATCGADNSICLWNLDPKMQRKSKWKSPYSRDLLHTFQLDGSALPGAEGSTSGPDIELPDRQQGRDSARTLAIHPNGNELACGDKQGKLYIYDLSSMTSLSASKSVDSSSTGNEESTTDGFNAHEAEVLTLNYSPYFHGSATNNALDEDGDENLVLLASAGRDRLIHVFDATEGRHVSDRSDNKKIDRYKHVQTLDSHSSSVTVVKFSLDGKSLISCGGDKTMVLHSVANKKISRKKSIQTPNGTINGLTMDIATNKYAVSTGQDKRVNVWNLSSGKLLRSYRPSGLGGEMYKCSMDPSGTFVATCSFDKVIRVFDFFSGEIVAQAVGHSDLITGVKFSPDGKYLLSIGGDGCIMAWTLSQPMVEEMEDRLLELFTQAEKKAAKVNEKARMVATGELKMNPSILNKESSATPNATSNQKEEHSAQEKRKPTGISREKKGVRTGGMGSLVGGGEGNNPSNLRSESVRPSTTAGSNKNKSGNDSSSEVAPSRPTTAPEKPPLGQQGAEKGKLFGGKRPSAPAWAMRKADASDRVASTNASGNSNRKNVNDSKNAAVVPKSRWAVRSDSNQLQILGKPISRGKGADRHKLTLEMTVEEATWKAPVPSSPSALAKTLEDSDDVLLEDSASDSSENSHDEDGDSVEGVVDNDGDSDEEDKLNRTNSQLDELEEHAMKLETWLERKLREEVALDDDFTSSLDKDRTVVSDKADSKVIKKPSDRQAKFSSSGKAALGQSLSSTFFRNISKNNEETSPIDEPPASVRKTAFVKGDDPPNPPPTSSSSVASGSVSSSVSASSEAMFQKRQETATAVAQMRERLRQMGILEKSGIVTKSALPSSIEQPPSPSAETNPDVQTGTIVSSQVERGEGRDDLENNVFAPPLPPPSFVEDSVEDKVKEDDNAKEDDDADDDTASTVSGGSAMQHGDLDVDESAGDSKGVGDVSGLDSDEEEAMRLVLKNLDDAREKALSAYSSLVSKKNASLSASSAASSISTSFQQHEKGSSSTSLAPPTICASSPMSQKRAKQQWGDGRHSSSSLDSLLSDFEHSFEAITKSTNDILTQSASGSGLYRSTTLSKWHQSTDNRSALALPTVSESFEQILSSSGNSTSKDTDVDGGGNMSSSGVAPKNDNESSISLLSSSINVEESNANIEAILEKYSDRLASMVSAKVFSASASTSASSQQQNSSDGS